GQNQPRRDDFGLKIGKLSHRTSIKDGLGRHIGSCGPLNRNFLRIKKLMDGHFKVWNEKNIKLLSSFSNTLTNENAVIFKQFIKARNAGFLSRVRAFSGMKLYRQTGFGNAGLIIAVLLKKL
ncbi:hypothetical protein ACOTXT_21985, partial [Enterobacter cloacae complex sp. IR5422]